MSCRFNKQFGIALTLLAGWSPAGFCDTAVIRASYENILVPIGGITTNAASEIITNSVVGVAGNVGGNCLHAGNWRSVLIENRDRFNLTEVQVGAPCGAIVANYGVGDELPPPDGAAENADPMIDDEYADLVIWLDYAGMLLAVDSGSMVVQWEMADGSTNSMTYTVSPDPQVRPVRLYWTDDENGKSLQNAGPTVTFGSNYRVDFYGNSTIFSNTNDYQWSYSSTEAPNNAVWLDGTELHAKEDTEGNFLVVYSRMDEDGVQQYLGHEVVKVLEPRSTLQEVYVGDRLTSVKRSYEIDDLFSSISRGAIDETGENPDDILVYKHGQGDKNGWIWAIRETEAAWQVEIYWKAQEKLDVIWPFEVDIYDVSWSSDPQQYVRGELDRGDYEPKVYIPSTISVEVMPYQTKTGKTGASDAFVFAENGELYTDDLGKFLLMYSTDDSIWFESIEAVSHTDFAPVVVEQGIATELEPGDVAYTNWPGYLYTPTGTAYNTNYYAYPEEYLAAEDLVSSIYAVNQGKLEVWWANASKFWTLNGDDLDEAELRLPSPIYFPSIVKAYANVWPEQASQIVIASGQGGNGSCVATNETSVLYVDGETGFVAAPETNPGQWGNSDTFTIETWVKVDAFPAELFQKGDAASFWSATLQTNGLLLESQDDGRTNRCLVDLPIQTNDWMHLALTRNTSGMLGCYLNGGRAANRSLTNLFFDIEGELRIGAFDGQLDELRIWDAVRSADELQRNMRLPLVDDSTQLAYHASFDADEEDVDYNPENRSEGGRPAIQSGLSLAGASPELYIQNDSDLHGYNPNEEHALIFNDNVYALRSDLNRTGSSDYTSKPFVLVEYLDDDDNPDMAIYEVMVTNELYAFDRFLDAGQMIQAPAPLNLMVPTWCSNNKFVEGSPFNPFQDRNGRFWAQQAGDDGGSAEAVANLYYPNQTGFWYPDDETHDAGEQIAWAYGADSEPQDYVYTASWPEEVPGLYIGDTLTVAKNGLPAVRGQLSVDVVYQQSSAVINQPSVKLIDPTRARKTAMEEVPGGMKSYRDPKTSYTFFSELPSALRTRMYWNGAASTDEEFQLVGKYVERTDGFNYLLLNVLSQSNRVNAVNENIMSGQDDVWTAAINDLPSTVFAVTNDETAVDSYALSTIGRGAGFVTLIFNDSSNEDMVNSSEVIDMAVIKVEPELFNGRLDTLLSDNPLDKQITLKYTADFAGEPEQFEFEWNYADPDNGSAPDENNSNWKYYAKTNGLHYATVGGTGVFGLSDHYLRCRYRALDPDVTNIVGSGWSSWTDPQLCEGWIKRALKEINPFEQRITDYINYESDTSLSMIQQAGMPYDGDIPLNYDALNDYGLIQIYETIYQQALDLCEGTEVTNSLSLALMMVSGRLADFYTLLGNEAYADALNPTVTLGSDDPDDITELSSIFCFQNQLPDLLSEELCLLRGRDDSMNTNVYVAADYPLYNRLAWNFTADIVGGEVAYMLNYGISDIENEDGTGEADGSIDEYDAISFFPQGHGDAWGHYLTAIKYYYAALHRSNFHWYPQVEGLLVGDSEVTVSYLHEKKFAVAAAAKAQAGLDILNKSWRQEYEAGADLSESFVDAYTNRAWGVSEWASRVGQGTYFDWLAANSLLPNHDSEYEGIRVIDRETTPELAQLAIAGRKVQQELDGIDAGQNPLGLAENTVPFDISSSRIDEGETHFEQIHARAEVALQITADIFERVQNCTQALRDQNENSELTDAYEDEETELNRRLIELYGYPYSDDIGPGDLYAQDYNGPDLVHYNYIERYTDVTNSEVYAVELIKYEVDGCTTGTYSSTVDVDDQLSEIFDSDVDDISVYIPLVTATTSSVSFCIDASGLPCKPDSYTGSRRAEGEIQIALSAYAEQLATVAEAYNGCLRANANVEDVANRLSAQYLKNADIESADGSTGTEISDLELRKSIIETAQKIYDKWKENKDSIANAFANAAPTSAGFSIDTGSVARYITATLKAAVSTAATKWSTIKDKYLEHLDEQIAEQEAILEDAINNAESDYEFALLLLDMKQAVSAQQQPLLQLQTALQAAETARMVYTQKVAAGDALQVERERLRINYAADLGAKRYRNMAYRIFRNDELDRYSETFDQSARFCYLAAKAYDYETGLLASESAQTAGSEFMEDIVKARTIGRMSSAGEPLVGASTGEPGLADILARMSANWDVLDGRLGFNNPQTETGRFSLRSELFRIKPAESGDKDSDENWRETLEKYRVDNLLELEEFKRYCLPFTPAEKKEPAIVIPFSTDISFGNNFFGLDLAGGDNAYDSTHFATKIRSVGIWFSNFDNAFSGGLANQPRVYLIPVGVDRIRVPSADMDEIRDFQVVDQALPVPYPFSENDWESPDWSALKDMLGDELFNIRRYPSMRAYHDSGDFEEAEVVNNSRLIGRSVWNTRWLLIIPGGTLLEDRDEGLDRFIHGSEVYPGVRDENGVKDIKIFFQTYSYSGN